MLIINFTTKKKNIPKSRFHIDFFESMLCGIIPQWKSLSNIPRLSRRCCWIGRIKSAHASTTCDHPWIDEFFQLKFWLYTLCIENPKQKDSNDFCKGFDFMFGIPVLFRWQVVESKLNVDISKPFDETLQQFTISSNAFEITLSAFTPKTGF